MPKAIRKTLGVSDNSRVASRIEDDTVSVHGVAEPADNPILASFLVLAERDTAARPEALVPLTPELAAHTNAATEGVAVDPDAPIGGEAARQPDRAATPREAGLGTRIAALFAGIGLLDDEEIPELRGYAPKPATFD